MGKLQFKTINDKHGTPKTRRSKRISFVFFSWTRGCYFVICPVKRDVGIGSQKDYNGTVQTRTLQQTPVSELHYEI